jgi:hypothetical protein
MSELYLSRPIVLVATTAALLLGRGALADQTTGNTREA